ncbi:MAG: restriction endonuclease subunit S [Dehalococcoidales bacterium]|nr:restriction endonuclease subunit S [Dehalococcoidales bacterium]
MTCYKFRFMRRSVKSRNKGTTRQRVNMSNVRNLYIPLAPIEEQKSTA